MLPLKHADYVKILEHYSVEIPKTKEGKIDHRKTKKQVRQLLANKLCRCIKKVEKGSKRKITEPGSMFICNKSIFTNRNLKHYRFTCKKNKTLKNKKGTNYFLTKTTDKIKLAKKSLKRNKKK